MSIAGDQVPEIPLSEVVGNAANVSPVQMAATCINVGVTTTQSPAPNSLKLVMPVTVKLLVPVVVIG